MITMSYKIGSLGDGSAKISSPYDGLLGEFFCWDFMELSRIGILEHRSDGLILQ